MFQVKLVSISQVVTTASVHLVTLVTVTFVSTKLSNLNPAILNVVKTKFAFTKKKQIVLSVHVPKVTTLQQMKFLIVQMLMNVQRHLVVKTQHVQISLVVMNASVIKDTKAIKMVDVLIQMNVQMVRNMVQIHKITQKLKKYQKFYYTRTFSNNPHAVTRNS